MPQYISFEDFGVAAPAPVGPNADIVDLIITRRRTLDLSRWKEGLVLLGYLGWPSFGEDQRRHEWLRGHLLVEQWGREAKWPPGMVTMLAVTKEIRNPQLRHLYEEFENVYYGGLRGASRVLQALVDLNASPALAGAKYGASLRLAYALASHRTGRLEEREGANDLVLGIKWFEAAWRAYGSVAPFGAAARFLENQCNKKQSAEGQALFKIDAYDVVFTGPDAVLSLAKAYQTFLSTFRSKGRRSAILPAGAWLIPDSLRVPEHRLPHWTLDDADHAFLARQQRLS